MKNEGELPAAATTLRYYSSEGLDDYDLRHTDSYGRGGEAAASESISKSVDLSAPSTAGTYYLGACVDSPLDEFNTTNNCSSSVQVDVQ